MENLRDRYNPHFNGLSVKEYITSPSIKKFQELEDKIRNEGTKPYSGYLRISLLDTCNEACFFCYNEGVPVNNEKLNAQEIEQIFEATKDYTSTIKLVGGEPLIHPQFDEIAKIAKKYAKTTITTNGVLIDKHLDSLLELDGITVSIHSMENSKYSKLVGRNGRLLNKVLSNISLLKEKGYDNIRINTILTERNYSDIQEVIDYAVKTGIKNVSILSLLTMSEFDHDNFVSPERAEEALKQLYGPPEMLTTTRNRFSTESKTTVDVVWQYCITGCNTCETDGFIRVTPAKEFSYCLVEGGSISFAEELDSGDLSGVKERFEEAIDMVGKPVPSALHRLKLPKNDDNGK